MAEPDSTKEGIDGEGLMAGGAERLLTPPLGVFLYGYPHVPRAASGVHDDLRCSALFVGSRKGGAILLANDLVFVDRALVEEVRAGIASRTGVPTSSIAITASHTHSGPVTVNYISNRADSVVPPADPIYLKFATEQMIAAGTEAFARAVPAEFGASSFPVGGIGTNRHDPAGPSDAEASFLMLRDRDTRKPIGCVVVYAMHPTVLHEDSTLISSDFPHFVREFLWTSDVLPRSSPILYMNGASGDQSPRHVVRANDFAEARRLGERLGRFVEGASYGLDYSAKGEVLTRTGQVNLVPRPIPSTRDALDALAKARARLEEQRRAGSRAGFRTAQCDVFGAEETAELARAAEDGSLADAIRHYSPAEIQTITIGPWRYVFWPGEFFVEHALAVKSQHARTQVVTLANGELQGYIVTPEAAARGVYEAGNAIFAAENGARFVRRSLELLRVN